MPHPIMFSADDFGLAELRRITLALPEATEKVSWGRPTFCAPKMFAMYGGNSKAAGVMTAYPHSVLVKVDESEREALQQDERIFYPAYMGPSGWLGLDLTGAPVDWAEVAELVDASYRLVAPARLIRQLDSLP
ncbi:MAG: MmcQ/YjbR family DNA-binding protein [Streptomycetaceae bacterium]|nr:MmcQ/YjbR family DNA-binding protein [Streptomycetaceae bacterium]